MIDLNWPIGNSVNSGVSADKYLDTDIILTYPSIDNITDQILKLGKSYEIFKVDISRAFRHVPIDPGDLDLLGLYWNNYFLDCSVPFGFKHRSSIFLNYPTEYALLWPRSAIISEIILMI